MEIERNEDGSFTLSEVEPTLSEILLSIPAVIDPTGHAEVEARLYPSPVAQIEGADLIREEWKEYVGPELQKLFGDAAMVVKDDLEQLEDEEDTLTISAKNVDAWLNVLNQARLALAARFEVTEEDMERPIAHVLEGERDLALFQIHFYGFLQECLIKGIESQDF